MSPRASPRKGTAWVYRIMLLATAAVLWTLAVGYYAYLPGKKVGVRGGIVTGKKMVDRAENVVREQTSFEVGVRAGEGGLGGLECIEVDMEAPSDVEPDNYNVRAEERLAVTYSACHGAVSQHYGHLSALAISQVLNASLVIVPPARTRDTYTKNNKGISIAKDKMEWVEIPISYVYNFSSFQEVFSKTVVTQLPRPFRPIPLPKEKSGWKHHHTTRTLTELHLENTYHLKVEYKRRRTLETWKNVVEGLMAKTRAGGHVGGFLVDLGCTDIMVAGGRDSVDGDRVVLQKIHEKLRFSKKITAAAEVALKKLSLLAPTGYDALHLRLEHDMFASNNKILKWTDAFHYSYNKQWYTRTRLPLFIGSGIFTYMDNKEAAKLLRKVNVPVAYHVCFPPTTPLDVIPWVDLFILNKGQRFYGHDWSSFSWLIVQNRLLSGVPLRQNALVVRDALPSVIPKCCDSDRTITCEC